jgi:hypothetical protein
MSNTATYRYTVNNLVIASIGAAASLDVPVSLPGAKVGDVGIAIPRQALTSGVAINPLRVSADNTAVIQLVNGTAGAIDPVDTMDFDVVLFRGTGQSTTVQ